VAVRFVVFARYLAVATITLTGFGYRLGLAASVLGE
jgi:hypothetical protein